MIPQRAKCNNLAMVLLCHLTVLNIRGTLFSNLTPFRLGSIPKLRGRAIGPLVCSGNYIDKIHLC